MKKLFHKKTVTLFILFTMFVSFSMSGSVFASEYDSANSVKGKTMDDPAVENILEYVSQDKNGEFKFDVRKAEKEGQSNEVIRQGKLFNQVSQAYADSKTITLEDIVAQPSGIPIWGNWCGPGYGGGPTKDLLDAACKEHDLNYERYGYFDCRSDIILINRIERDYNRMGFYEQGMATAVKAYFNIQIRVNGCL